jgi:hypothetical protein
MIAELSGWPALLEALRRQPPQPLPAALDAALARAVLAAPAAIAWWIAHRAPSLAARPRLRVLVAGAELIDAADDGRWYQYVPALLGSAARLEATLLGDRLEAAPDSAAARHAPATPARRVRASLGSFLREAGSGGFDAVFLFQPGLQKHRGWLEDGSLAALVRAGVPVVCSAYGEDEAQVDGWVAQCHGYAVDGPVLLNPFFLELSDAASSIRWGRALWRFGARAPAAGAAPDRARLQALDTLSRMVMHSMTQGEPPRFAPGATIELRAAHGAVLRAVHLFDGRLVDPASGELWRLAADGELRALGRLEPAQLAARPGPQAGELEHAIWAAGVKAAHLRDWYGEPAAAPEPGAARARRMYAELRARAERALGRAPLNPPSG